MSSCTSIDPLVTPYVDGELASPERGRIEQHLGVCAPCRDRVIAEQATRDLLVARRAALRAPAPAALLARCAAATFETPAVARELASRTVPPPRGRWRPRLIPMAAAATVLFLVGGAIVYDATGRSTHLLAAELAADHLKCLAMNTVVGTNPSDAAIEHTLAQHFDWVTAVPRDTDGALHVVGSRPCLYGRGKIAHVMYRHNGRPVSLYMLPNTERAAQTVEAFGYACAIWSRRDRTFVLVARDRPAEVQKLAASVRASMP